MRDTPVEPLSAEHQRLLAAERDAPPEDDGLRSRVLKRARAAHQGSSVLPMRRLPRSRRTWLLAAALATAFAAVSFAAFRSLVPESRTSVLPPRSSDEISLPPPGAVEPRQVEPRQTELQAASGRPALPPEQAAPKKAERDAAPRRGAPADAHLLELGVLQRARVAVANGQFATALEAIAEHQRRFPNGSLQEEREALRVKALAGLGKTDDASAAARRFREKFPNSVLSPRRENAPPKAP